MSNITKYTRDAFKSLELLEDKDFNLSDKDAFQNIDDFINDDIVLDQEVIDLDAETEEELKDSYVDDAILMCPICHTNIFKGIEDIEIDEENDRCCVGESCPVCGQEDGFVIIGKVAPFKEEETEVEVETEPDEAEVEVKEKVRESFKKKVDNKRLQEQTAKINKRILNENKKLVEAPVTLDTGKAETTHKGRFDETTTFEQWFNTVHGENERYRNSEYYPFDNYVKIFESAESLRNATAEDIVKHAHEFYDFYDVDSADREEAFNFACDVTGRDYDDFYLAWREQKPIEESLNRLIEAADVERKTELKSDDGLFELVKSYGTKKDDNDEDVPWIHYDVVSNGAAKKHVVRIALEYYGDYDDPWYRYAEVSHGMRMRRDTFEDTEEYINVLTSALKFAKQVQKYMQDIGRMKKTTNESRKPLKTRKLTEATDEEARKMLQIQKWMERNDFEDTWEEGAGWPEPTLEYMKKKNYKNFIAEKRSWVEEKDSDYLAEFDKMIKGLSEGVETRDVTDQVIVKRGEPGFISKMHDLRDQGYEMLWSGNGEMCFTKPKVLKTEECKELKEEVSDLAYDMAVEIDKRFAGEKFISWDDFNEAFEDAYPGVIDPTDDKFNDLETDVRGILSYLGWETIYEGEDEGGLKLLESRRPAQKKPLKESKGDLQKLPQEVQDIVGEVFDYTMDFDFLDVVADVLLRIDDFEEAVDNDGIVLDTVDDTLIYTDDQWEVLRYYFGSPSDLDSESWDTAFTNFASDIERVCAEVVEQRKDEKEVEESKQVNEAIENATIETEDQVIKVSSEDKEEDMNADWYDRESMGEGELLNSEEEMIAPLSDEDIAEIEDNQEVEEEPAEETEEDEFVETEEENMPEEEDEFEFDEIEEESFNRLGESYIKKVYSNVNGFKVNNVSVDNNKMVLEGIITFNSGKTKKTSFVFERVMNKNSIAKDKARYVGLNETFTDKKNAYVLNVSRNNKTIVAESLRYNYPAKTKNLNEAVKIVKGLVK